MDTRPRIAYKGKYIMARNIAITASICFIVAMVFAYKAAKANLDTQIQVINPSVVSAEITPRNHTDNFSDLRRVLMLGKREYKIGERMPRTDWCFNGYNGEQKSWKKCNDAKVVIR